MFIHVAGFCRFILLFCVLGGVLFMNLHCTEHDDDDSDEIEGSENSKPYTAPPFSVAEFNRNSQCSIVVEECNRQYMAPPRSAEFSAKRVLANVETE